MLLVSKVLLDLNLNIPLCSSIQLPPSWKAPVKIVAVKSWKPAECLFFGAKRTRAVLPFLNMAKATNFCKLNVIKASVDGA